ncbi:MAG: hypothetical protein QOJ46_2760 [bacterium]
MPQPKHHPNAPAHPAPDEAVTMIGYVVEPDTGDDIQLHTGQSADSDAWYTIHRADIVEREDDPDPAFGSLIYVRAGARLVRCKAVLASRLPKDKIRWPRH